MIRLPARHHLIDPWMQVEGDPPDPTVVAFGRNTDGTNGIQWEDGSAILLPYAADEAWLQDQVCLLAHVRQGDRRVCSLLAFRRA